MLIYARAIKIAHTYDLPLISPTWVQFNLGPYLRKEKDKRHYANIFKPSGVYGLKKYFLLNTMHSYDESEAASVSEKDNKGVIVVEKLKNRFLPILHDHQLIADRLMDDIYPKHLSNIPTKKNNAIGVHLRLGDYEPKLRMSLFWYATTINKIRQQAGQETEIHIFTDGTDEELKPFLKMTNSKRVFYGSAISDIIALSRYKIIVASDSTFSAWGSYLGQVPTIYCKRRFGKVLEDESKECILKETDELPQPFVDYLRQ
jgi:hypothetical protein